MNNEKESNKINLFTKKGIKLAFNLSTIKKKEKSLIALHYKILKNIILSLK